MAGWIVYREDRSSPSLSCVPYGLTQTHRADEIISAGLPWVLAFADTPAEALSMGAEAINKHYPDPVKPAATQLRLVVNNGTACG